MNFDLVIRGGRVVAPGGVLEADVGISGGVISAIWSPDHDRDAAAASVAGSMNANAGADVDARGKYVLPGVVDAHVHFNDPGFPDREDMASGTAAAAAGGVTTVIDMPLSGQPAVVSLEALELKKKAAAARAKVDYALWGGLVNDNVDEMEAMSRAGAVAFKAFTCFAGDDFPYATPDVLLRGMKEARRLGLLLGVHCEDQALTSRGEAEAAEKGTIRSFLHAHSPLTERLATQAVLEMAKETGARVHICHATLPEVVDAVRRSRLEGVNATVETCPHYLLFSEEDLERIGPVLKCAPPVRSRKAVEAMWERVFDGSVDLIASDHSPSTLSQKNLAGSGGFLKAWGGVQGVQTLLPALFTEGVKKRGLPLKRLTRLISAEPARLFGLYPRKGALQVGSDADLTIFDPETQWTVKPEDLFYKNPHTPYMGMRLQGRVEMTCSRGRIVYYVHDAKTCDAGAAVPRKGSI
ncbi:MAG: allantoinase AllB [Synergistaceae bacterium]|jgi:allantoinase|nr:allantoinase AllB [Synergistaceae bacterium]